MKVRLTSMSGLLLFRITLGNQLDGTRLLDPDVVNMFKGAYPDGSAIKASTVGDQQSNASGK